MPRPIFIIVFFVLSFLFFVFFSLPSYQELRALQLEIAQKRAILQSRQLYLSNLENLAGQLKEQEPSLAKVESALPQNPELPSLLALLQRVSSKNGLVLKKIEPFSLIMPRPGEPQLGEAHLGLTVSGTYPSFKAFLEGLERSSRLIELEALTFSAPRQGEIFDFELDLKAYFASSQE